jgi:UPF0755 protein
MFRRKSNKKKIDILSQFKKYQPEILKHFYSIGIPLLIILVLHSLLFHAVRNRFDLSRVPFRVERNMTANEVLNKLNYNQLVRNRRSVKLALRLAGWGRELRAGKYMLSPSMSVKTIFETLRGKRGLSEDDNVQVVIPEGYSQLEIFEALEAAGIVSQNAMQEYIKKIDRDEMKAKYLFLGSNDLDNKYFLEGYLYPDTYSFALNTTPSLVLEVMLRNFTKKAGPLLKTNKTRWNAHQLLTLASIVEKEAVKAEERELIAGVFYNRLRKYMHMGSCPTVKYAMGKPRQKYLLFRELNYPSPYNTYRKIGLPPGPICSPGAASISAVLHPQETEYFYFVALGDGTHIFSKSLNEHLNYQKVIQAEGKVY